MFNKANEMFRYNFELYENFVCKLRCDFYLKKNNNDFIFYYVNDELSGSNTMNRRYMILPTMFVLEHPSTDWTDKCWFFATFHSYMGH